jgi:hypothetical protein
MNKLKIWPEKNLDVELDSKRRIRLVSIRQKKTYEGLMAGMPNKKMNAEIISASLEECNKENGGYLKCILIEPVARPISNHSNATDSEEYESLPPVMCAGKFTSTQHKSNENAGFTQLKLLWFQDEFGVEPDDEALTHIKKVDWDKYAQEQSF